MHQHELDGIAPVIARWLAPHLAPLLAAQAAPTQPESAAGAPVQAVDLRRVDYDEPTCRLFVRELGDTVVARSAKFFKALSERQALTSLEVSDLLGLPNQRSIGANMTVSLSKRTKALGLAEPWTIDMTPDGERTIWRDREGIAARMTSALEAELDRRDIR